jgi:hypothetical protein
MDAWYEEYLKANPEKRAANQEPPELVAAARAIMEKHSPKAAAEGNATSAAAKGTKASPAPANKGTATGADEGASASTQGLALPAAAPTGASGPAAPPTSSSGRIMAGAAVKVSAIVMLVGTWLL